MNASKVKSSISKELWEATGVNNVKIEDFDSALTAVAKLKNTDDKAEFRQLCIDYLAENQKNPIIPRFLATICGKHPVDDTYAFSVFDDYYKDNKWKEIEYLAKQILNFNESSYILKALAECYEINDEQEKKIEVWDRLVKTDHSETEVFYKLASYYESKGENEIALNYYKRVIQRHLNAFDLNALKNVWPKVMQLKEDNADYLIQLASRIAKTLGNEKGVFFLNEILENGHFDINSNIKILKRILDFSNKNQEAIDKLISLLREKYISNPRLEYCLSNTGLLHNYIDADVAVRNFEKEIEFVEGAFVYHNTWKLGRIKKIEKDEMQIQFLSRKDLHSMSCNMAFSSLKILPKQHILVLKAGAKPEQIKEHLMANTEWGVRMMLNSYPDGVTLKQMKTELVPSILNDKEWTVWSTSVKKELASNPYFGTSDESNDIFVLRETPITYEEKTLQVFSREKGFFNKYAILKDFIKKNGNTDCEEFVKIVNYFENEVQTKGFTGICAFMILDDFKNKNGMTFIKLEKTFEEFYTTMSIDDMTSVYSDIQDSELRKTFVSYIVNMDSSSNKNKILSAMLHVSPSSYLMDNLSRKTMDNIRKDAVDNYQTDPDFILWLLKESSDEDWENVGLKSEEILILQLQILLSVNGKLAHGVDNAQNKIRSKQLTDSLFGDQKIVKYLSKCDTNSAKRIFSYTENIPGLDDDKRIGIKHYILSNRKDSADIVSSDVKSVSEERMIPKGFLCTKSMFNIKSAELEHIMNVEIPENSKEIGTARDLGDLRENAEYQYAKDKQKNLNFMMNKLTDEIDIAKIVEPESVDLNFVEFGTKVTFTDNLSKTDVSYIVFGPWESNPEKNILNFQAPLGLKIYNMKKGENKKFEINGVKYDYTVKKIELADFNFK